MQSVTTILSFSFVFFRNAFEGGVLPRFKKAFFETLPQALHFIYIPRNLLSKNFFNLLDKELSKFDNYLNFKYIYDKVQDDVFIDIVHTSDIGNKIFAKNLQNI